jgi:uncharacterized membrane protein
MRTTKRLGIYIINITIFILLVAIILSSLYFVNGSLEEFPTKEQHEKVRLAMALVIFILIAFEAVMLFIRKSIKEKLNR